MQSLTRQFDTHVNAKAWPIITGPIVVCAYRKNVMKNNIRRSSRNRDGPLIFQMRDGPPNVTGPPGGTGPPDFLQVVRSAENNKTVNGMAG